jgi:hypothetical protein
MTGSSQTFIYEFGTGPTTEHRNEQNIPVLSFSLLTCFFFSFPFPFFSFFYLLLSFIIFPLGLK